MNRRLFILGPDNPDTQAAAAAIEQAGEPLVYACAGPHRVTPDNARAADGVFGHVPALWGWTVVLVGCRVDLHCEICAQLGGPCGAHCTGLPERIIRCSSVGGVKALLTADATKQSSQPFAESLANSMTTWGQHPAPAGA